MSDDEDCPFRLEDDTDASIAHGPKIRENVDAGTDVLDLTAFRRELEEDRRNRRGGGGSGV